MNYKMYEGDYAIRGTVSLKNGAVFTFLGEKEDECKICLSSKKTKEKIMIDVPTEYCRGSLRSVKIVGFRPADYEYDYYINGKRILDEYARVITGREKWMDFGRKEKDFVLSGGFLEENFNWKNDHFPERKREELVLYKLHMRGFTMDRGCSKKYAGTFRGLQEKIPYLSALGVTTLECMPIYEFEEMTIPQKHELPDYVKWKPAKEDRIAPIEEPEISTKVNFWGYGPGNYFAVKSSYAYNPQKAANELKALIHELHNHDMELVMEIYFPEYTNHNLILDVLRFWVLEYHVDGFHLLGDNLPIVSIASDAVLSRTKLFYLGFDAYLFEQSRHENLFVYRDEYQYPAKKVLNHLNADMTEFMDQQRKQGVNYSYVNYITGNNGFTLNDLFTYNDRHNEANGEGNADGNPWNFSSNQGVEGPSRKKGILNARKRQWKNAWIMLLTAQSVPLIWSGDEFKNSQEGNNNAYCQDNEIGWINWKKNAQSRRDIGFVTSLLQFRKNHPVIASKKPFTFSDYKTLGAPDLSLHGVNAWMTDLNPGNMAIGVMYCGAYSADETRTEDVYIAYNFFSGTSQLALPKLSGGRKWYLQVDTADMDCDYYEEPIPVKNLQKLELSPMSVKILIGK